MSEKTLMEFWDYTDADLNANRHGQLTEKQKSILAEKQKEQKSFNSCLGAIVVGVLGFMVVGTLLNPALSAWRDLNTEGGDNMQPIAIMAVLGLLLFIIIGVSVAIFKRVNRKADHVIRRAEGTVNFVWVERKERTSTGSGYKTVRSLEMRVGPETKFTGMSDKLPSLIDQGDEWIFYYVNYPFMFLSAEKISKGK